MELYHFSEEPDIRVFKPRIAPSSNNQDTPYVWAIDEWHAPMYYTPRDCPRACFWPGEETTAEDRERWFGAVDARLVICIESGWLERLRSATLYRYAMPRASFLPMAHGGGHWVSESAVTPQRCEPVGDLIAAIGSASVELRITPSLVELWKRVIASTLEFSGTRLRNAKGWADVDWDALPRGSTA